jgi:SAM-dependent methyltransferase
LFTPREGLPDPDMIDHGFASFAELSDAARNGRVKANLYFYPELYNLLKHPDPEDVIRLRNLATRHLGERTWRVLDPACGPANWLKAFSNGRNVLVGNDSCDAMVHFAARQLAGDQGRAVCGDMYNLPLGDERFDLVFEASGVTSIVRDIDQLSMWLEQLGQYLLPGGVIVLLVNLAAEKELPVPSLLWESPWRDGPGGGKAQLRYEILEDALARGIQRIRRTVQTRDMPQVPRQIVEDYDFRVWRPGEVAALPKKLKTLRLLETCDAYEDDSPTLNGALAKTEQYFVFGR